MAKPNSGFMGSEFFEERISSGTYQPITQELYEQYVRLIYQLAYRYAKKYDCGSRLEDLIQEGAIAMIHAWNKFDPERGIRFSTYLVPWIRAHMRRYLANNLNSVRRKYMQNGVTYKGRGLRTMPDASLDAPIGDDDFSLHSILTTGGMLRKDGSVDGGDIEYMPVDEQLVHFEQRAILRHVISIARWSWRAQPILEHRVLADSPRTFDWLAEQNKVSKEAIRLWECATLLHIEWLMKAYLAGKDITQFPYTQTERRWASQVSGSTRSKSLGHVGREAKAK